MGEAERAIDGAAAGGEDAVGECEQVAVFRVDEGRDLVEAEELVARLAAEDVVHRGRPEHPPAGEVPIDQAAAAAQKGGVDAGAGGAVDGVCFPGPRRLGEEGIDEDQDDAAGAGKQRGVGRERAPPVGEHRLGRLHERDHAARVGQMADGGDGVGAVGEGELQHAGAGAEDRQRLRLAQKRVEGAALEVGADGSGGEDDAGIVGEQNLAAIGDGARRQRLVEGGLQDLGGTGGEVGRGAEIGGDGGGDEGEGVAGGDLGLLVGADEGGRPVGGDHQDEDDSEDRNGAPEHRLVLDEPGVRRGGEQPRVPGEGDRTGGPAAGATAD